MLHHNSRRASNAANNTLLDEALTRKRKRTQAHAKLNSGEKSVAWNNRTSKQIWERGRPEAQKQKKTEWSERLSDQPRPEPGADPVPVGVPEPDDGAPNMAAPAAAKGRRAVDAWLRNEACRCMASSGDGAAAGAAAATAGAEAEAEAETEGDAADGDGGCCCARAGTRADRAAATEEPVEEGEPNTRGPAAAAAPAPGEAPAEPTAAGSRAGRAVDSSASPSSGSRKSRNEARSLGSGGEWVKLRPLGAGESPEAEPAAPAAGGASGRATRTTGEAAGPSASAS